MSRKDSPSKSEKKLVCVAYEGAKTEPDYISLLKKIFRGNVLFKEPNKNKKSDPINVLKKLKDLKKEYPDSDYFWGVFDVDGKEKNTLNDFHGLFENEGFNTGISNPCFEVWLLQHLEKTNTHFRTSKDCKDAWNQKKHSIHSLTKAQIEQAIKNCKDHKSPIPESSQTTIGLLVDSLLKGEK